MKTAGRGARGGEGSGGRGGEEGGGRGGERAGGEDVQKTYRRELGGAGIGESESLERRGRMRKSRNWRRRRGIGGEEQEGICSALKTRAIHELKSFTGDVQIETCCFAALGS